MERDQPTLAVLVTRDKNNKLKKVYRYYDGSKWKKGNESNHKKKLKELQDAARPKESTETVGDNVEEKAKPANKPGDVPARRDPVKPVQPNTQGPPGQTQANPSTPTQQAVKPVTASSVQVDSTPIALDLTDPDESKVDIVKGGNNGVSYRGFMPKPGVLVSSVVDGGALVWKATGDEKCTGGNIYGKDDSLLLDVSITTDIKFNVKYFEKVDGKWREVALNDFLNKLAGMSKSGSSPNPSSDPSTSS